MDVTRRGAKADNFCLSDRPKAFGANLEGRNGYHVLFVFDSDSVKKCEIRYRMSDICSCSLRLHS